MGTVPHLQYRVAGTFHMSNLPVIMSSARESEWLSGSKFRAPWAQWPAIHGETEP